MPRTSEDATSAAFSASATGDFEADTSGFVFALPAFRDISVSVTDSAGAPVPGAGLTIEPEVAELEHDCGSGYVPFPGAANASCVQLMGHSGGVTDAEGTADVLFVDDPSAFGSGYKAAIRATGPVGPGQTARSSVFAVHDTASVALILPAVISLAGHVVTADGAAVPRIPVAWSNSDATAGVSTTTAPDTSEPKAQADSAMPGSAA